MLDKDGLNGEISVGVTFASLMAAISLFFTGVLIAQYQSFGPTIKVPLLFLIVSTFSFIFAATIYNNAGTEVTLGKLKTVEKYMIYAKNIVEFLGLYPLILSMPLVIGAVTADSFLRTSTTIVAIIGIALYSQSKFSILEKQLSVHKKRLYSALIVILALLLYLSQTLSQLSTVANYTTTAVILLLSLLFPTIYFSLRSKQYRVVSVRSFRDGDAVALSKIIHKNLDKIKSKKSKHSTQFIESTRDSSSEEDIRKMASEQQVFVAVFGSRVVGFASLDNNKVSTIFTDPDVHRKGIGRMLIDAAECAATECGHEEIIASADLSNQKFYEKLGYLHVKKHSTGEIVLRKEI